MFGLRHPETANAMQKKTRVQTTSRAVFQELDQRICDHSHEHSQIAGRCRVHDMSIQASKFASFYPRAFAKAIVKGIIQTKDLPIEKPIYHVEEDVVEPPKKKAKLELEDMEDTPMADADHPWTDVFQNLRAELPKSGVKTSTSPMHATFRAIQSKVPGHTIGAIKAGKGLDRYITGEHAWHQEFPMRHTIVMRRMSHKIEDLGNEEWSSLSRAQQSRKAVPSHIMLCIFYGNQMPPPTPEDELSSLPKSTAIASPKRDVMPRETSVPVDVPTWTPMTATVSGPKFLSLSEREKGVIQKLHKNLGHPTAEKLARHMSESRALQHLSAGARDYVCPSCAERVGPQKTTPGNLRDPLEFNEKISLDGFEWKSKTGLKTYVLHILDEATRFHLGKRVNRDSEALVQGVSQIWLHWAGPPQYAAHDAGGEFVSQEWNDFLQEHGIRPVVSAAPWQRGRIERHGGTVKEMLDRIDHEHPIESHSQFDEALRQCFHAKNTMSVVSSFSPEQAVLGKASRLPASIISDEDLSAHMMGSGQELASEKFRQQLELRSLARAAFSKADNSDALRRAMHHQSRGMVHHWSCGQLCMYWDKRKSPNVLEKGRWCGPAQVICQESRTIIWINHMNRLLRCAKENIRPVSMREFQSHATFNQTSSQEQLQQMAKRLQEQLKSRSGLFQYADLSQIPTEETTEDTIESPSHGSQQTNQPEEEPVRHTSLDLKRVAEQFATARETPVPDSPVSAAHEEPAEDQDMQSENNGPSTASLDTDHEEEGNDMEPVYNVTMVENGNHSDINLEDEETIWSHKDAYEQACVSFAFEMPRQQMCRFPKRPEEHFPCLVAAAKKSRAEVVYNDLTPQEKEQFAKAKQKELKCWLDTDTVKAIMRERIHPSRIMSSRWILTWKEDSSSPNGRKARARLVVKGFQDPDIGSLNSDSPTMTRDSRMLLLQTVSSMKWTVQSFDITTAFLRGKSDDRELAMEAPRELRDLMGMGPEHVCLLKGNAYGRVDAPLLFYKEFRKRLENVGFTAHPLDSCLFLLRNKNNPQQLDGILGTHVDDGIGGGNQNFEKALEQLQKTLPFGTREFRKFKFTGLDIEQLPDRSIRVNQSRYVHKINPINIPKIRRATPESPITDLELHQLRGLCGSLQYAAVHSRPDIATKVACLQKGIPKATVETLLEGNRVLREAQSHAETSVTVRPIPLADVSFASFGDASFASAKQLTAQQGLFIMSCSPKLAVNETTEFSPIVWHSKQIGRVVRSTLSAEAYAMSTSLDKLTWIRCMWGFIKNPSFKWHAPETALLREHPGLMITDCKSLYDLVTKNATPNCQEWRTTIEVMLLKQQSQDDTVCRWVSTAIMLADCLTKPMDATFLRTVLSLGKFRIYDEDLTLKQNSNRKYGVTWTNNRI